MPFFRPLIAFVAIVLFQAAIAQTVCIDPGHPSEVGRGTQGKSISEVKAVWLVGKKLEKKLKAAGLTVVLTKGKQEQTVKNRQRAAIANAAGADIMVRLHCDASSGTGFAVYYPDRQGKSGTKIGPSQEVIDSSRACAEIFHQVLAESLKGKLKDNGLRDDTHTAIGKKQGALTGSIYSEVPVLLVEMCVLTNPKDEKFIASEKGQELMAEALAKATLAALGR